MKIKYHLLLLFIPISIFVNAQQKGTEEQYISRLATIKSPIELSYHAEVKKYIDAYIDNPEKTRELIGLSKYYFPMIERSLRSKNIPTDLKYLAVAISELNPSAQNISGSTGIWMMSYNVSKMYKLKINSYLDERRDPLKSSTALASHFKDLFSIYKQWTLSITAYGCSPVMLNKCIRMSGNSLYFWDIYPNIPDATKDLYPRFVAAVYIMNFYREHGIKSASPEMIIEADSVIVNRWLSFQQISSTIEIPLEQLRKLNPEFKKDIIPFNVEGYWIHLPKNKVKQFSLLKDSLYSILPKSTEFTPVAIQQAPIDSSEIKPIDAKKTSTKETSTQPKFDKKKIIYSVKKGDVIGDVADWFDVSAAEIKSWNKLTSTKLKSGQKITVWAKASKTGYYKRINNMNAKQKRKLKSKD